MTFTFRTNVPDFLENYYNVGTNPSYDIGCAHAKLLESRLLDIQRERFPTKREDRASHLWRRKGKGNYRNDG